MKIIIIALYFGKLPLNFNLWVNSCKKNKMIDWLFITDNLEVKNIEEQNFKVMSTTLEKLKYDFEKKLKFKIKLEKAYKLCDYKPAYGYLFYEKIKEYDFWGYCDLDMIFGKIDNFLSKDILNNYDKILRNGHLTLYKNTKEMNEAFKEKVKYTLDYQKVFKTNISCGFDESKKGIYGKILESNKKQYLEKIFIDINPKLNNFLERSGKKECYTYENGKIFINLLKENKLQKMEMLYIHFQKRNLIYPSKINNNLNYIISNKIISFSKEEEIIEYLKTLKNNSLKNGYYLIKFYFKNWYKMFKFKCFYIKNLMNKD